MSFGDAGIADVNKKPPKRAKNSNRQIYRELEKKKKSGAIKDIVISRTKPSKKISSNT